MGGTCGETSAEPIQVSLARQAEDQAYGLGLDGIDL